MSVKGRSPELRGIKPLIELSYIAAPRSFVGWHGKSLKLTKSRKFFHHPGCIAIYLPLPLLNVTEIQFCKKKKSKQKHVKDKKIYQNSVPLYHSQINTEYHCTMYLK